MTAKHSVKVNGRWYRAGEEIQETVPPQAKQYTRTEIARMNKAELQEAAANAGIENAYDTSGTELKKLLIEHFGL